MELNACDNILITWYVINVCVFTGEIFMDIAVMLFIIEASRYYFISAESGLFIELMTTNYSRPFIIQNETNRSFNLYLSQVL